MAIKQKEEGRAWDQLHLCQAAAMTFHLKWNLDRILHRFFAFSNKEWGGGYSKWGQRPPILAMWSPETQPQSPLRDKGDRDKGCGICLSFLPSFYLSSSALAKAAASFRLTSSMKELSRISRNFVNATDHLRGWNCHQGRAKGRGSRRELSWSRVG